MKLTKTMLRMIHGYKVGGNKTVLVYESKKEKTHAMRAMSHFIVLGLAKRLGTHAEVKGSSLDNLGIYELLPKVLEL